MKTVFDMWRFEHWVVMLVLNFTEAEGENQVIFRLNYLWETEIKGC
jgi:hypothetical protein